MEKLEKQKEIIASLLAQLKFCTDSESFYECRENVKTEYNRLCEMTKDRAVIQPVRTQIIAQVNAISDIIKRNDRKERQVQSDYEKGDVKALNKVIAEAFTSTKKTQVENKQSSYTPQDIYKQIEDCYASSMLTDQNGNLNSVTKKIILTRINNLKGNAPDNIILELVNKLNSKPAKEEYITSKATLQQEFITTGFSSTNKVEEHEPILAEHNGQMVDISPLWKPEQ